MTTKIFVNLPVKNLEKSVKFFTELGFRFDPQFTDKTATCMIVAEDIFVMLLTEDKFKTFTPKEICDAKKVRKCFCVYLPRAGKKSMKWFVKQSLPEPQPIMTPKTTVSCTGMVFRIWMVTSGN